MTVVAEGVETAAEFRFLRDEHCDTARGYYLSRPVPSCDLISLIREWEELAQVLPAPSPTPLPALAASIARHDAPDRVL